MSTESVVVVVAGGPAPEPAAVAGLPPAARVVAADSGLEHALALGLQVDLVVGDMDSVGSEVLAAAEAAGTRVDRHPQAKDQTDLELALGHAAELGPDRMIVVAGGSGRLDHLLAAVLVLGSPRWAGAVVEARLGTAAVHVVRDRVGLAGRPGDLVSLLPVGGPARGVTTEGLVYPLHDEDLPAGISRGVSNELVGPTASVRLRSGTLLAVLPGAFS